MLPRLITSTIKITKVGKQLPNRMTLEFALQNLMTLAFFIKLWLNANAILTLTGFIKDLICSSKIIKTNCRQFKTLKGL